jgi:hypothetical protein
MPVKKLLKNLPTQKNIMKNLKNYKLNLNLALGGNF